MIAIYDHQLGVEANDVIGITQLQHSAKKGWD
jgi:hypothetical protein